MKKQIKIIIETDRNNDVLKTYLVYRFRGLNLQFENIEIKDLEEIEK